MAATRSEVQPDKLRRLETWLLSAQSNDGVPTMALLIDFVPVSGGPAAPPFAAGEMLAGEVVFYPSMSPLRGQLVARSTAASRAAWPALQDRLPAAMAVFEAALTHPTG